MYKIFIDGQAGTTGLQIHQRLANRTDVRLLAIDPGQRKNLDAKRRLMEQADVVMLCLPDDAARETVRLAEQTDTRIIDASSAHRTSTDWTYGLPELNPDQRDQIRSARLVSNPGCYATGFLLSIAPLVHQQLLKKSSMITISALSGYSGGGNAMIDAYEKQSCLAPGQLWYSRPYSLNLNHKHLPEMQHYAGLAHTPLFLPSVGHFRQGMLVSVGLFSEFFTNSMSPTDVYNVLAERYQDEPCVRVFPPSDTSQLDAGFLDPQANNDTNSLDLFVFGHNEQVLVTARLDNLGKGASGAAVQNMNLMLGLPELTGLNGCLPVSIPA